MWARLQGHVAVSAVCCRDVSHQWDGKGDQLGHGPTQGAATQLCWRSECSGDRPTTSVPEAPAHLVNLEKCFHLHSGLLLFHPDK